MSEQPGATIAEMLQELDISRQILRMIFDNIKSAILLCSPDTRIIFVNKHAREGSVKTHGRTMQIGESIMSYRVEGDEETHLQFKSSFERVLQTKKPIVDERKMHYPPETVWLRTEYTPLFDGDNIAGILLHFHNVTDRKEMESWTEHQANILNEIAWSQSHETRQPLATLLGLINILDKKSLTDDNKQIVALLEETASKLESIISQNVIRANKGSSDTNRHKKT